MSEIPRIGNIGRPEELAPSGPARSRGSGAAFGEALREAIERVDDLQRASESAQAEFAGGGDVELHEVLIKVGEAEIAFRTMMEVRNKLVDAYREVMRMGSGG